MKTSYSRLALLFIALFLFASTFYFQRWKSGGILAGGDSWEYYVYNPALFIHHDLDNLHTSITYRAIEGGNAEDTTREFQSAEYSYPGHWGRVVIKAPIGIAILQAPFFGIAHEAAKISGARTNGLSPLYLIIMHLSTTFYVIAGLFFLRKVLLLYFSEAVTSITLIGVSIATNLLFFCAQSSPMAHPYLFFLCSIIIYSTVFFYKTAGWRYALFIGFAAGLTAICRPNDILFLSIPLLFGLTGAKAIKQRAVFLRQNFLKILAAIMAFCLAIVPQMLYWRYTSGHWIYYSYGNETFDFSDPHIRQGLFGYANGFFPYAPVMLLALVGIPLLTFKSSSFKWLIPIFFIIHTYIIYSWWCWTYVNGLGSRPMVETYPLLAIPMATTVHYLFRERWGKWTLAILIPLFVAHQFSMAYQYGINLLWSEASNRAFYWSTLFKTKAEPTDLVVFDLGELQPTNTVLKQPLYFNTLLDSAGPLSTPIGENKYSLCLNQKGQTYTFIDTPISAFGLSKGDWIKVSCEVYSKAANSNLYDGTYVVVQLNRGNKITRRKALRMQNKIPNKPPYAIWHFEPQVSGSISFYSALPSATESTDTLKVFVINEGNATLLLNNMRIEAHREP